jgi:hypothetical protein
MVHQHYNFGVELEMIVEAYKPRLHDDGRVDWATFFDDEEDYRQWFRERFANNIRTGSKRDGENRMNSRPMYARASGREDDEGSNHYPQGFDGWWITYDVSLSGTRPRSKQQ